jgi:hypothetical protein
MARPTRRPRCRDSARLERFRGEEIRTNGDGFCRVRRARAGDPLRACDRPGRTRARDRGLRGAAHRSMRGTGRRPGWYRRAHRCSGCRAGRPSRGTRHEHGARSRRGLGYRVHRPGPARVERRPGRLARVGRECLKGEDGDAREGKGEGEHRPAITPTAASAQGSPSASVRSSGAPFSPAAEQRVQREACRSRFP